MRRIVRPSVVAPLFLAALSAFAPNAFGAAQLAAGAKTSAQPTATNPQQRQLQITFDPTFTYNGEGSAVDLPHDQFHLDDFRLSVQYDPLLLSVQSIIFLQPYSENGSIITNDFSNFAASSDTLGAPAQNAIIDPVHGLITNISGFTNPNLVPPGDVNNFVINFVVNTGVSYDTPLFIRIFGGEGDYTHGTDPITGDEAYSTPPDIEETILNLSFNQLTANIAAAPGGGGGGVTAPLPTGALAGGLCAAGLLVVHVGRRKARMPA